MGLLSRRELHSRGVSDGEIRAAIRSGAIVAVRRGYYTDSTNSDARQRYLWLVQSTARASSSGLVVSHKSAAVLHGFETWGDDDTTVHLTANRTYGGRSTPHRTVHALPLGPEDIVEIGGVLVTSPARTAIDLACLPSFESAVCTGDAILRTIHRSDLEAALDRGAGRTGIERARRVVNFLDGRSESVGESRSRVYLQRNGFPAPHLQRTLLHPDGRFVARPDFEFDGVIGEFDGLAKYRGPDSADAVIAEKRREDLLRSLGWLVVRWTWDELTTELPAERLRRALSVAATLPPPRTVLRC